MATEFVKNETALTVRPEGRMDTATSPVLDERIREEAEAVDPNLRTFVRFYLQTQIQAVGQCLLKPYRRGSPVPPAKCRRRLPDPDFTEQAAILVFLPKFDPSAAADTVIIDREAYFPARLRIFG